MRHRIVYLQRATLDASVRVRRPAFDHEWIEYPDTSTAQMVERLAGASIAISNKVRLPREVIASLPDLKLIAIAATGSDSIDLEACREHGVMVTNVRAYSRHSVAEHTLMLMLCAVRHLKDYALRTLQGEWNGARTFYLPGPDIGDLHGRTLAIAGQGGLGREVARLAQAFGMRVHYYDIARLSEEAEDLLEVRFRLFHELLRDSDIVSLHVPLNDSTRHLIGEAELSLMQPHALLINTSRGAVVDEKALLATLTARRIAGAGLDVYEVEPPPRDHPFFALDNVVLTAHMAGPTQDSNLARLRNAFDNLQRVERGEPPLWVIPELGG